MNKNTSIPRPSFDATFTTEEVERIEAEYNTTWGVNRRVLLLAMTLSSEQMLEKLSKPGDNTESLLAIADAVIDYKEHLEGALTTVDSCLARIATVAQYETKD
jgi:hypothetical protein